MILPLLGRDDPAPTGGMILPLLGGMTPPLLGGMTPPLLGGMTPPLPGPGDQNMLSMRLASSPAMMGTGKVKA